MGSQNSAAGRPGRGLETGGVAGCCMREDERRQRAASSPALQELGGLAAAHPCQVRPADRRPEEGRKIHRRQTVPRAQRRARLKSKKIKKSSPRRKSPPRISSL